MARTPEQCLHRKDVRRENGAEFATCGLLVQILRAREDLYPVRRDACEACCGTSPRRGTPINPIQASLILEAANLIVERGGVAGCDISRADRHRGMAMRHLSLILPDPDPIAVGPLDVAAPRNRAERRPARPGRAAKIGLIGWNTATGVGTMNRELVRHGIVERWLAPEHPQFTSLTAPASACKIDTIAWSHEYDLGSWLEGLEWLIFVEHPYFKDSVRQARERGVRVAVIPMWELAHPRHDWLRLVDLVICPHAWSYQVFTSWKERYGMAWDVVHLPWPIDTLRLPFRERQRCRRFLFVNGTGGCRARSLKSGLATPRRKGVDLVLEAAALLPSVPFLVYTQLPLHRRCPPNVELRTERLSRAELYQEGDVCVQPSHWEGLGLQLLECQAAGMPLLTTDAPPMNEFKPFHVVPVHETDVVSIADFHPLTANFMRPQDLAAALAEIHGADIRESSRAARDFIERERSWDRAVEVFRRLLTPLP